MQSCYQGETGSGNGEGEGEGEGEREEEEMFVGSGDFFS